MLCPKCGGEDQKVIDVKRGEAVDERQVLCKECGAIFITETKIVGMVQRKRYGDYRTMEREKNKNGAE
jgi:transcriptional regulator NrdR family protein